MLSIPPSLPKISIHSAHLSEAEAHTSQIAVHLTSKKSIQTRIQKALGRLNSLKDSESLKEFIALEENLADSPSLEPTNINRWQAIFQYFSTPPSNNSGKMPSVSATNMPLGNIESLSETELSEESSLSGEETETISDGDADTITDTNSSINSSNKNNIDNIDSHIETIESILSDLSYIFSHDIDIFIKEEIEYQQIKSADIIFDKQISDKIEQAKISIHNTLTKIKILLGDPCEHKNPLIKNRWIAWIIGIVVTLVNIALIVLNKIGVIEISPEIIGTFNASFTGVLRLIQDRFTLQDIAAEQKANEWRTNKARADEIEKSLIYIRKKLNTINKKIISHIDKEITKYYLIKLIKNSSHEKSSKNDNQFEVIPVKHSYQYGTAFGFSILAEYLSRFKNKFFQKIFA